MAIMREKLNDIRIEMKEVMNGLPGSHTRAASLRRESFRRGRFLTLWDPRPGWACKPENPASFNRVRPSYARWYRAQLARSEWPFRAMQPGDRAGEPAMMVSKLGIGIRFGDRSFFDLRAAVEHRSSLSWRGAIGDMRRRGRRG